MLLKLLSWKALLCKYLNLLDVKILNFFDLVKYFSTRFEQNKLLMIYVSKFIEIFSDLFFVMKFFHSSEIYTHKKVNVPRYNLRNIS